MKVEHDDYACELRVLILKFYDIPEEGEQRRLDRSHEDGDCPHAHSQTPMTPRLEDYYARINQFTAEYFRERGLPTIEPSTPDEVLAFARWMLANAPEMEGYITIKD